ncbi:MAG: flippase [Candidatus Hydrogenedentes bacterium]|nr:flippase [Candidatus Hydrogenedentota bacterium]
MLLQESSRIGLNASALLVSRFLGLALSLVQSGLIFRSLGVDGTGQFGFALGYASLFTVFATLGIHRLLMRDISRNPDLAGRYLWTAELVVGVLSILVFIVVVASTLQMDQAPQVRWAVAMAALSVIVLWALQQPFEGLLLAKERMVSVALVNILGAALRLLCVYMTLHLAASSAIAHGAIALGNVLTLLVCVGLTFAMVGWLRPQIHLALAWAQVRECSPFMLAMVFSLIYFKLDISLLMLLKGEVAVGMYTPAQRVTEPIMMLAGLWGTSVFPALCRFSLDTSERYAKLKKASIRLALLIAFPVAFGLGLLAEPIINLLVGARAGEFSQSVRALQVLAFVIPLFYFNGIVQEILYASHRDWSIVGSYGLAAIVSVLGNLLFIPLFGVFAVPAVAFMANLCICVMFGYLIRIELGSMNLIGFALRSVASCSVMGLGAYTVGRHSLPAGVALGMILYAVMQWILNTLEPDERRMLVRAAQNLWAQVRS